jgi:pyrroloquinoline quinone biosynthesis protein B
LRAIRHPVSGHNRNHRSPSVIDGDNWAILNASPDIRQQMIDNSVLHPKDAA